MVSWTPKTYNCPRAKGCGFQQHRLAFASRCQPMSVSSAGQCSGLQEPKLPSCPGTTVRRYDWPAVQFKAGGPKPMQISRARHASQHVSTVRRRIPGYPANFRPTPRSLLVLWSPEGSPKPRALQEKLQRGPLVRSIRGMLLSKLFSEFAGCRGLSMSRFSPSRLLSPLSMSFPFFSVQSLQSRLNILPSELGAGFLVHSGGPLLCSYCPPCVGLSLQRSRSRVRTPQGYRHE